MSDPTTKRRPLKTTYSRKAPTSHPTKRRRITASTSPPPSSSSLPPTSDAEEDEPALPPLHRPGGATHHLPNMRDVLPPSTPDDEALHRRFHAKSVGGVDLSCTSRSGNAIWRGDGEEDVKILLVDRKSAPVEKRKVREVMEVVDTELGAAEIADAVLWQENSDGGDRFRVYLYVHGKKCVGLLLVERIKRAYYVLDEPTTTAATATKQPEQKDKGRKEIEGEVKDSDSKPPSAIAISASSSVSVSSTPRDALMGVTRIWTCSSSRRKGIARRLLECARSTFIYGNECR